MPRIKVELDDDGFTNEIERLPSHKQKPQVVSFKPLKHSLGVIDRIANKCDNFQDIADALYESWHQLMHRSCLLSGVDIRDVDGTFPKAFHLSLEPYRFGDPTTKYKNAKPINEDGTKLAFGVRIEHHVNGLSSYAFNFETGCTNSPIQIVNNDHITTTVDQKLICRHTALFFLADWPALANVVAIERLTGSNRMINAYYDDRRLVSDWWYW